MKPEKESRDCWEGGGIMEGEASRFGKDLEGAEPKPKKTAAKEMARCSVAITMTPSQKPRQKPRLYGSGGRAARW